MPATEVLSPPEATEPPSTRDVHSARRVSGVALAWTLIAGTVAVGLGLSARSLALIAFGGVGLLDAAGSATLVLHFRHAVRHDAISDRFERVALLVVTTGMLLIGCATIALSINRLATRQHGGSAPAGAVLAALSMVALTVLTHAKRRIANTVGSSALLADAWLSAMGALLAVVTLAGTGLTVAFGWWWVDPSAAILIGGAAVILSVVLRVRAGRGASS